ncbi:MAG: DoxX family protein [Bacteroidales bacterium]|nr:DoxX family protein [Bacteroidales bacterium]MCL2133195.1 DoxX family protein [Bacteroidales bacterium]
MNKPVQILSSLVGVVFLVSGIGKSIVAYEFSQILAQYGFDALAFFAPLLIMVEVALGLLLFFCFRLRQISLLALCFVAVLSAGYCYGYFFKNITDCGCFGYFSLLNLSPFFTGLRNIILIGILLYVFIKTKHSYKTVGKSEIIIMAAILCAVCFTTGYTYTGQNNNDTHYITKGRHINKTVHDTVLGEFLNPAKDSSYLVFAFSYSCPHCFNSIENLKQYERQGVVDKVLAISFVIDTSGMERFKEIFQPDFTIVNYPPKQLFRLTNRFPVSYYIKNGIIKMEIRGLLPCAVLLRQLLVKID